MKDFLSNLAALLKVKTLVTLVVIIVFAALALKGSISPDNVMIIISMVVSFYFGTQHEKKSTGAAGGPQDDGTVIGITDEAKTPLPAPVDTATYNETHPDSM